MDINDIDVALHEIKQMVLVAIGAAENLHRSDEPEVFCLSEADTDLLSFSIFDIQQRVAKLKASLNGGNECA
jgi:hypothetical protein